MFWLLLGTPSTKNNVYLLTTEWEDDTEYEYNDDNYSDSDDNNSNDKNNDDDLYNEETYDCINNDKLDNINDEPSAHAEPNNIDYQNNKEEADDPAKNNKNNAKDNNDNKQDQQPEAPPQPNLIPDNNSVSSGRPICAQQAPEILTYNHMNTQTNKNKANEQKCEKETKKGQF